MSASKNCIILPDWKYIIIRLLGLSVLLGLLVNYLDSSDYPKKGNRIFENESILLTKAIHILSENQQMCLCINGFINKLI